MKCPTPCVCGEIVELHEMRFIEGKLPDGGNLVCVDCWCNGCEGSGICIECSGAGFVYGDDGDEIKCPYCYGQEECHCPRCNGLGYRIEADE